MVRNTTSPATLDAESPTSRKRTTKNTPMLNTATAGIGRLISFCQAILLLRTTVPLTAVFSVQRSMASRNFLSGTRRKALNIRFFSPTRYRRVLCVSQAGGGQHLPREGG